jgi:hypothetical protein
LSEHLLFHMAKGQRSLPEGARGFRSLRDVQQTARNVQPHT